MAPPLMTHLDVQRLTSLLATRVGLAYREEASRLRNELLRRATVIASHSAPPDLVTMNSTVLFAGKADTTVREVTIVYPWRANERGVVSVLSRLGMALLGRRVGTRTDDDVRVLELRYQPEAAGDWHL